MLDWKLLAHLMMLKKQNIAKKAELQARLDKAKDHTEIMKYKDIQIALK